MAVNARTTPPAQETLPPEPPTSLRQALLVGGLLAILTLALYWPVRQHEFINYDDPDYVTENHYVRAGLTWAGVEWAFLRIHGPRTYWHPLTWLSHMLDCQLFGLNAGPHHLVNVGFHAVNVVLLFLLLRGLTGAVWRSALAAALFGWHPLQVDTVAWVTERKNLLSTLFFLLTVWAYARYARRSERPASNPSNAPVSSLRPWRDGGYWLAVICFALGLMCKPAIVILPAVLLLLDYWPLARLRLAALPSLLVEKLPFFLLSAASSVLTLLAHARLGIVSSGAAGDFESRLGNALVSYGRYLRKVLWPHDLAVFYPYAPGWAAGQILAAFAVVAGVSFLVWRLRNTRPYLLVGWCWFLGALVPTIGLIQVGSQSMADRFAYIPLIGLFVLMVWGIADVLKPWRRGTAFAAIVGVAVILACLLVARRQIGFWRDSVTLFRHTAAVTRNNVVALNNLGTALLDRGLVAEAEQQYRAAIATDPNVPFAYYNLGNLLETRGAREEALAQYRRALELDPRDTTVYFKLADALARANLLDDAIRQYEAALRLDPEHAGAHNNLAIALARTGRYDEATRHALTALRLDANNPEVHNNLGNLCAERGQTAQALAHYRRALRIAPNLARAHYNLGHSLLQLGQTQEGWQSIQRAAELDPHYAEPQRKLAERAATTGDWADAVRFYSNVVRLDTNQPAAWNNLGGALAELGQFANASNCFWQALRLQPDFAPAQTNLAHASEHLRALAAVGLTEESPHRSPANARAHYALARALHRQGDRKGAAEHLVRAAEYQPDWLEAANDAAWLLATAPEPEVRDAAQAVRLAERANVLARQSKPNVWGTLAAAYAEAGRFAEAVDAAQKAIDLADRAGAAELARQTRARLELYRAGKPLREP